MSELFFFLFSVSFVVQAFALGFGLSVRLHSIYQTRQNTAFR